MLNFIIRIWLPTLQVIFLIISFYVANIYIIYPSKSIFLSFFLLHLLHVDPLDFEWYRNVAVFNGAHRRKVSKNDEKWFLYKWWGGEFRLFYCEAHFTVEFTRGDLYKMVAQDTVRTRGVSYSELIWLKHLFTSPAVLSLNFFSLQKKLFSYTGVFWATI